MKFLGVDLFGFILFGTVCASCTWISGSFSGLENFQAYFLKYFFDPFLSLFSFCDTCNVNVHILKIIAEIS